MIMMVWYKVTTMIETSQASKTWGARWSRLLLCKQREDAGIEDNEGGDDFVDEDDNHAYLIIVADAADAVSVNFSGRCKFLQI